MFLIGHASLKTKLRDTLLISYCLGSAGVTIWKVGGCVSVSDRSEKIVLLVEIIITDISYCELLLTD